MSSAICFNLDQSKMLSFGNRLTGPEISRVWKGTIAFRMPTLHSNFEKMCRHDMTEILLKAV